MKNEAKKRDEDFRSGEQGLAAYDLGDWNAARRLLRRAAEGQGRKQDRIRAGELANALSFDRFALKLGAALLTMLVALFVWIVL